MKYLLGCILAITLVACGLTSSKNTIYSLDAQQGIIRLFLKDVPLQHLQEKRIKALERGVLLKEKGDWVPALIAYGGKSIRAKVRLKGDLSDHWSHEKEWSLKVKLEGGEKLKGMNRFALQRPATRGFLNEWVLHKFLSYSGLVALKYDFVEVAINGESLPTYAIEENISDRLIKRHRKPNGVLFKFDGDFYWRQKPGLAPRFFGAGITPFEKKKVINDKDLSAQLIKVRASISDFRNEKIKAHELFDYKQMAKLFVALDIMGHHHATAMDNIRFYYNPNTKQIEPIGYDNQLIADVSKQGLLGANKMKNGHYAIQKWNLTNGYWYQYLFSDSVFMGAYLEQLSVMSKENYLDAFFNSVEGGMSSRMELIGKSYPEYEFKGKKLLYANQEYIRQELEKDSSLGYSIKKPDGVGERPTNKISKSMASNPDLWNEQWDVNLALLDILGCSDFETADKWLQGGMKTVNPLSWKVVKSEIWGSLYTNLWSGERPFRSKDEYRIYIETLHRLCNNEEEFDKITDEIAWFAKSYSAMDEASKAAVQKNRKFLKEYLSPYKAAYAHFIGTNSPVESIVFTVQNIHKLPILIKSVEIMGEVIPMNPEVLVTGYVEGSMPSKKRMQLKVGKPLLLEIVKVINDPNAQLEGLKVNYTLYGTEQIITEEIIQGK